MWQGCESSGRSLLWCTNPAPDRKDWEKLRENSFMENGLKAEFWHPALPRPKKEYYSFDRDVRQTSATDLQTLTSVRSLF